jgi:hypothetical protein
MGLLFAESFCIRLHYRGGKALRGFKCIWLRIVAIPSLQFSEIETDLVPHKGRQSLVSNDRQQDDALIDCGDCMKALMDNVNALEDRC